MPIEDLRSAAKSLVAALNMRAEYMELVGSNFPSTTKSFLNGQYPRKLPKSRRKNTASCKHIIKHIIVSTHISGLRVSSYTFINRTRSVLCNDQY